MFINQDQSQHDPLSPYHPPSRCLKDTDRILRETPTTHQVSYRSRYISIHACIIPFLSNEVTLRKYTLRSRVAILLLIRRIARLSADLLLTTQLFRTPNTPGGSNSASSASYHYSNTNGSYYYANDNGSTYYNPGSSGQGSVTYTAPASSGGAASQGGAKSK